MQYQIVGQQNPELFSRVLLVNHQAGVEQTLVLDFDNHIFSLEPPNLSSGGLVRGIDDELEPYL